MQLRVDVELAPDAGAAELDEAARLLRSELLEFDVVDVALLAEGPPPPGARAIEASCGGGTGGNGSTRGRGHRRTYTHA